MIAANNYCGFFCGINLEGANQDTLCKPVDYGLLMAANRCLSCCKCLDRNGAKFIRIQP